MVTAPAEQPREPFDLAAAIEQLRAANANNEPRRYEHPWTEADYQQLEAERRADARKEGLPGECPI